MTTPFTSPVFTTGIKGPVVARMELREFIKDADVLNLFILAMDQMMKTPQENLDSWFQIAAIHGRPYIPYDNVGAKGTFHGYCCHSSTLFPPWHRPYLALYEQVLGKNAKDIAYQFQNDADRTRYTQAAERFRIPYWDWALEAPLPDIVATQQKVTVTRPDGKNEEIDNPLYGYKFNPVYSDFGDGLPDEKTWESWKTTVRYPTTTDDTAVSSPDKMQDTLKNNQYTLRDRVYNLLTQVTKYDKFSHDASGGIDIGRDGLDSIESIHNQMHVLGGANGHMGVVDYASFDPVFWMHHVMVDRLFAIWQELNPNEWVNSLPSQAGTFTRFPGETEDGGSLLTPFRKPAPNPDTYWTANEVRQTTIFNYTYPEVEELQKLTGEDRLKRIRSKVNELYGKTAPVNAVNPSVFKPLGPVTGAVAPPKWQGKVDRDKAGLGKAHFHEWFANIQVEKYALKQSFIVHIFLGDVPSDPRSWGRSASIVGSHTIFANRIELTGCAKCRSANEINLVVGGTIPLTHALGLHFGSVSSLEAKDVLPYLKQKLSVRVETIDGKVVDVKNIPSLKVNIGSALVELPESHEHFPKLQKAEVLYDACKA